MRIFVTGASGYAGYYAALRFAAAGHRVTGLVRNPQQPRLNILRTNEIALVKGDVAQPDAYRAELQRSDVIVHAMFDKTNPFESDRTLFAAIAALPEHAGTRRRFIYTTGNSIFGKVDVPLIDESTEPNPNHALAFRRTLEREALALPNVSVVVLRPGFMYGNDGFKSGCHYWFSMAGWGDAVFRGDRAKGWSWVHVDDLADAYLRVVEAGSAVDGEVFHLADDLQPRALAVMQSCLTVAGFTKAIRFDEPIAQDPFGTWFDQNEFITSAKAHRMLGWIPRHPGVIESIAATYEAWAAARKVPAEGQPPA